MSPLVFLVLAVVLTQNPCDGQKASIASQNWSYSSRTIFVYVNELEKLSSTEVWTTGRKSEFSISGYGLLFANFGFKFASNKTDDPLLIQMSVTSGNKNAVPVFSPNVTVNIRNKIDGNEHFKTSLVKIAFADDKTVSDPINLLRKDQLLNPANGWYDKERDLLKIAVVVHGTWF